MPDVAVTGSGESSEIGRMDAGPFGSEDKLGPVGAGAESSGLEIGDESLLDADDADDAVRLDGDFGS